MLNEAVLLTDLSIPPANCLEKVNIVLGSISNGEFVLGGW
jgi:hypothetical protein